jgi:hypothetical protein
MLMTPEKAMVSMEARSVAASILKIYEGPLYIWM